jgi:hypothetical protein
MSGGAAWARVSGFEYTWPLNVIEAFPEAYRAQVPLGSQVVTVTIGFTDREAVGMKDRRRAVVFIGSPNLVPAVEFSGANDFDKTGLMASVIKLPRRSGGGHQHLRPGQAIPAEYTNGFRLGIYSDVVRGPYAAGSMAVYATKDELDAMARHGLIRALWKGWI